GGRTHRRLLLDFAVAADHGETGPALQARKLLIYLDQDPGNKSLVLGIVHGAADAQHVHAGGAYLGDGLAQGLRRGSQLDDIKRRPAGAATEHVDAIDAQREIPVGAFDLEGAETGAAQIDGDDFPAALHLDRDPVTGRLSMRVRPPELRPRHFRATPPVVPIPVQFRARPLVAALDDKM